MNPAWWAARARGLTPCRRPGRHPRDSLQLTKGKPTYLIAMLSDNRKIGTGLLALGGVFLLLGSLFFDAGLLAIGASVVQDCFIFVSFQESPRTLSWDASGCHRAARKKASESPRVDLFLRTPRPVALVFTVRVHCVKCSTRSFSHPESNRFETLPCTKYLRSGFQYIRVVSYTPAQFGGRTFVERISRSHCSTVMFELDLGNLAKFPSAGVIDVLIANTFHNAVLSVNPSTGDVLFLSGITMTIGPRRTFLFFFKRKQLRGNLFFFGGMLLVFFRWVFTGMILQVRVSGNASIPSVRC